MTFIEVVHSNKELIELTSVFVTAFATAILTWFTASLVRQTKLTNKLAKQNAEPDVFVKIWPSDQAANLLNLVLTNTGGGNAYDVTVQFDNDTNHIDHFPEDNKLHFFNIKSGDELTRFIADYIQIESKKFGMLLQYKDKQGKIFSRPYMFDLGMLEKSWMDIEKNWSYEQYKQIKKIGDDIHNMSTGFKRLKIETFDAEDRALEDQAWEERRKSAKEKAKKEAA